MASLVLQPPQPQQEAVGVTRPWGESICRDESQCARGGSAVRALLESRLAHARALPRLDRAR